jgi:predicted RNA-binding Zn ribbon-like protein
LLQLVIDFVNTLDLETGADEFTSPEALAGWLAQRGLLEEGRAGDGDLAAAIELREALRATLATHNGAKPEPGVAAVLEHAAERGRLSLRFTAGASVSLEPRAGGVAGALARLLALVAAADADGTWPRAKVCQADDCRWAFYDHSRNRSGRWCDMSICGNRHKVRNYRSRLTGGAPVGP